jgi:hypothetical protein
MIQKINKPVFLCIVTCLVLTGCNFPGFKADPTKTPQSDEVQSVLQTAMSNALLGLTQTASASGKPTIAPEKTNTPAPAVLPTQGKTQPVVIAPSGTDNAALVSETIPDDTKYLPGSTFTKSWRVMNSGTSTWTTDYKLVFADGDQMGAGKEFRIPMTVDAGKIIDLSVAMKAPDVVGTYKGYWKIQNPNGKVFGPGQTGSFWVKIVVSAATPTVTTAPSATPTATTQPTATLTLTPVP